MAALTRIADEPILERGLIASPDIVVVADETLLDDALARPLQGLTAAGRVLMNSKSPPEVLRERYGLANGLAVLDGTELALTHVRSVAGVSVALAAATCKLVGLSPAAMEHAVREELAALGLDHTRIGQNVALAHIAYERLTVLPARQGQTLAVSTARAVLDALPEMRPQTGGDILSERPHQPLHRLRRGVARPRRARGLGARGAHRLDG
jgi:Pyruvate/2-oxoacid:ferredoxin oxidoreductase gamma subunit